MAWVAKRSTTVRNAVNPMTKERSSAPSERWRTRWLTIMRAWQALHHVLVLHVLDRERVDRNQHRSGAAAVLPPVRRTVSFRRHVTSLVCDRDGTIAGVFDHLAGDDIDHRRSVRVAMPGNNRAGLHVQLPQSEQSPVDCGGLLGEIGARAHHIGHVLGCRATGLLALAVRNLLG